jgi:phosphoesterase family protein
VPTTTGNKDDYIPHHEPFQYYASTTNPHHLPPASLAAIGTDTQTTIGGVPQFDKANHQYDMSDCDALVGAIAHGYLSPDHLPAVSFLKAPGYQDGHADYSDPLDEQQFIANEINALQHTPDWSNTAVIIAYDDSDGWYDHAYSGIHNPSNTSTVADPPGPQDFLTGAGTVRQYRSASSPRGAARPLRLRTTPTAAGRITVCEAQLHRPHADHPVVDTDARRGQLESAPYRRIIRCHQRNVEEPVRLPLIAWQQFEAVPGSCDR